ncbi:hypothetical protein [Pontibacter sp. G13]|nr:hypothetical protein [Pontibacter sp. G13]WNJ19958.1 hypothetical protein RJD25_05700 [Pontibacter sp. G13]
MNRPVTLERPPIEFELPPCLVDVIDVKGKKKKCCKKYKKGKRCKRCPNT